MLKPWWEIWAGRLEYELEALSACRISARVDKEVFAKGVVKIDFEYRTPDGVTHAMFAVFSDLYPYFRFEIYAPTLSLPHHQNPIGKNLCLVDRDTASWRPTDTLAEFITNRLKDAIAAGTTDNRDEAAALEQRQAEPFSAYYKYTPDAMFLIDSAWVIDSSPRTGELVLGLESGVERFEAPVRGAVLEVRGPKTELLAQAPPEWPKLYPSSIRARWVRVGEPIATSDPEEILETVKRKHPGVDLRAQRLEGVRIGVLGILFPEEVGWREPGVGWIFLVWKEDKWHTKIKPALVRAARAGRGDLARRLGDVARPLSESRIAMVGFGGLGAPAALEFARSGIAHLNLLDPDVVDPGTAVRWPLGFSYSGLTKPEALKEFIEANFPYTTVTALSHRLGGPPEPPRSDLAILDELLKGVDLIFDATAELGLQYFLSELARERRIPYIAVSTTFGVWGGLIARLRPEPQAGCWWCLQRRLEDGTIPAVPADPNGIVQPAGCAAPTYTGTSFDAALVSQGAIRLAISTLVGGSVNAYAVDWDVAVISLRDDRGRVIAPVWWTSNLLVHPECTRPH